MPSPAKTIYIVTDANVLIDYYNSDKSILGLISSHLAKLLVAQDVFEEVEQLLFEDLEELGIEVVEPGDELVEEATYANIAKPSISYQDWICFLLAQKNNCTCLTSDGGLRKVCKENQISVMWGLEPMKELVRQRKLSASEEIEIAKAIHLSNTEYITSKIIKRFTTEVKKLAR